MGTRVTAGDADLTQLDDPEFLAARAELRRQFEQAPDDTEMAAEYQRMTAEFDRRARSAWGPADGAQP